jgi:hypothetical protein
MTMIGRKSLKGCLKKGCFGGSGCNEACVEVVKIMCSEQTDRAAAEKIRDNNRSNALLFRFNENFEVIL